MCPAHFISLVLNNDKLVTDKGWITYFKTVVDRNYQQYDDLLLAKRDDLIELAKKYVDLTDLSRFLRMFFKKIYKESDDEKKEIYYELVEWIFKKGADPDMLRTFHDSLPSHDIVRLLFKYKMSPGHFVKIIFHSFPYLSKVSDLIELVKENMRIIIDLE